MHKGISAVLAFAHLSVPNAFHRLIHRLLPFSLLSFGLYNICTLRCCVILPLKLYHVCTHTHTFRINLLSTIVSLIEVIFNVSFNSFFILSISSYQNISSSGARIAMCCLFVYCYIPSSESSAWPINTCYMKQHV